MTPPVEMIVSRDADPGVRTCAEAWAECLRDGGLDVSTVDVADATDAATAVIVAPHASLRPLADDPLRVAGMLKRSVCVSTSRLGSGALGADRPFHGAAGASVSLSRDAALYLTAHGIETAHLKPGGHPCLRAGAAEARTGTIGVHTRYSGHREDLLAGARDVLDPYPCDLRISRSPEDSPPEHLEPEGWLAWLASLDVVLSLPQSPGPGMDWCEVAPAVMNGAVVLTTAESDFGPLEPGDAVATATAPGFADSLRRLLADADRREQIRASALESLASSPLDVAPLAEAIEAASSPGGRTRGYPFAPVPRRAVPPSPLPDLAAAEAEAAGLRARRGQAHTGTPARIAETSGWRGLQEPEVSVVIPSYDYAQHVADAVESALAARGVALELIVVDDGSTDGSAEIVRGLMETHDQRAILLHELGDNGGLAAARNRGIEAARAPLVLLLDADDTVLAHGPRALVEALEGDPGAAFAYGFVARHGLESEDLLGTSPWDPQLFREGNYVPVTAALVRRSAWERAGGFSADGLLELGWEDWDFWMRLADLGERAAHVRRIVAAYRVHDGSMSALTNRHAAAIASFLAERHPQLLGTDGA